MAEALGAELIRHGRNRGPSATYETGLRAVRHEWVALLDDDDEWLPHHLETLWALTPGSVLVASSCVERVPGSSEHTYHGPLTREPIVLDSPSSLLHPENLMPSSAAMFHRDSAIAAGGFRAGLCEDLDLWCRLLDRGRATLSPRVGTLYHIHPGQVSSDWEEIHAAHLDIARSFAGEAWWSKGLVERRAGVTAWDRFRGASAPGPRGGAKVRARPAGAPCRTLGVVEVCATGRRCAVKPAGWPRAASHRSQCCPERIRPRSPSRTATRSISARPAASEPSFAWPAVRAARRWSARARRPPWFDSRVLGRCWSRRASRARTALGPEGEDAVVEPKPIRTGAADGGLASPAGPRLVRAEAHLQDPELGPGKPGEELVRLLAPEHSARPVVGVLLGPTGSCA